jgi:hypothetical protein
MTDTNAGGPHSSTRAGRHDDVPHVFGDAHGSFFSEDGRRRIRRRRHARGVAMVGWARQNASGRPNRAIAVRGITRRLVCNKAHVPIHRHALLLSFFPRTTKINGSFFPARRWTAPFFAFRFLSIGWARNVAYTQRYRRSRGNPVSRVPLPRSKMMPLCQILLLHGEILVTPQPHARCNYLLDGRPPFLHGFPSFIQTSRKCECAVLS